MAPKDNVKIYIDGVPVEAKERHLTGAELRSLVDPPADNLWLDIANAQDHPVAPTEKIALTPDMHFFTDRPRTIYIDKIPYTVRSAVLTEPQLRAVPTPEVPEDHGIWKDIPDDLDDPIDVGEIVAITNGDRFFTKALPRREIPITVNRKPVTLQGTHQTGMSIKEAAIAQGVLIKADFLLSRKDGQKYKPVDDDEAVRVHREDEFRANDGDDNS